MTRKLLLVEDEKIWSGQFEKALRTTHASRWSLTRTVTNMEDALDFIDNHPNEVDGIIFDMRILRDRKDQGPAVRHDRPVYGAELIRQLVRKGWGHIRCVGVTVHMAVGDPVRLEAEEIKAQFPTTVVGVITKSINPEETVEEALSLL